MKENLHIITSDLNEKQFLKSLNVFQNGILLYSLKFPTLREVRELHIQEKLKGITYIQSTTGFSPSLFFQVGKCYS